MRLIALIIFLSTISGCVRAPTLQHRQETGNQLAASHNWQEKLLHTSRFDLLSYQPKQHTKENLLTVYIEGDGLAWINKHRISDDPTPINPVGLKLALQHPTGQVAYLARPCQYLGGIEARNCNKTLWTSARFSKAVLEATHEAIDKLKQHYDANTLQLVGFSGGGAIATLLAAQREDVSRLITVAGNLNHKTWTAHHRISPLTGSLNPADYKEQLSRIEQTHYVGSLDTTIPPFLTKQFVDELPDKTNSQVKIISNQTHSCCWEKVWFDLMSK